MTILDPTVPEGDPDVLGAVTVDADTAGSSDRRRSAVRPGLLVKLAIGWIALLVILAVIADWLPLRTYSALSIDSFRAPGTKLSEALGTDELGRSELTRVIYGARVSLLVAVVSVSFGLVVGGLIGLVAGYERRIDRVVGVVVDSVLAFPGLVLILTIVSLLTPSLWSIAIALGVLAMPTYARLARANTLAVASREYVLASRMAGAGHLRILFREILPNIVMPVVSYGFIVIATVIVAEGSLSFLGMGIPPPRPSWGGMIADGRSFLNRSPHLVFVPAAFLLLTVFAVTLIGDWLRRRLDVRESML